MAGDVLPFVRLLIPCDTATFDLATSRWVITNPRTVSYLPSGAAFPFREEEFWVYAQLTCHGGEFDLAIEMRQLLGGGTYRTVGWGGRTRVTFSADPLTAGDIVFAFRRLSFREEGLYEFRLLALHEGQVRVLDGSVAELRYLELRDRI